MSSFQATLPGKPDQHLFVQQSPNTSHLLDPAQVAKLTLRSLAKRVRALDTEIASLDVQLQQLVAATAPTVIARLGIGTGHAAQLLITAGQNTYRLTSEAAFARLCVVAPGPFASGEPTG